MRPGDRTLPRVMTRLCFTRGRSLVRSQVRPSSGRTGSAGLRQDEFALVFLAGTRENPSNANWGRCAATTWRCRRPRRVGMTTTAYSGSAARPMAGWIVFAATMLMVIGSIDFFEGLIAVIRKQYYALTPNQVIVFNMTTWGWLMMLFGIVLFLTGMALWSGMNWARWVSIVLISINVLGQLSWLGSNNNSLWALTAIALNIVVLYALTARWTGYRDAMGAA